jgi:hypothetical protein
LEATNWSVTSSSSKAPLQKGQCVVDRPTFELQVEDNGGGYFNLELVTKPPGARLQDFE